MSLFSPFSLFREFTLGLGKVSFFGLKEPGIINTFSGREGNKFWWLLNLSHCYKLTKRGEQWMNLSELAQYIGNEEKAEQSLLELGILKRYTVCPLCGEDRIGRVRRTKHKCYRCNKEWGVRRGSILEGMKIPFTKFLMAIKLFELDTSVRESAKQLGLAYNTVYHLYQVFRHAIVIADTNNRSRRMDIGSFITGGDNNDLMP